MRGRQEAVDVVAIVGILNPIISWISFSGVSSTRNLVGLGRGFGLVINAELAGTEWRPTRWKWSGVAANTVEVRDMVLVDMVKEPAAMVAAMARANDKK